MDDDIPHISPEDDRLVGTSEFADILAVHHVTVLKKLARDPDFPRPTVRGVDGSGHRWLLSRCWNYVRVMRAKNADSDFRPKPPHRPRDTEAA